MSGAHMVGRENPAVEPQRKVDFGGTMTVEVSRCALMALNASIAQTFGPPYHVFYNDSVFNRSEGGMGTIRVGEGAAPSDSGAGRRAPRAAGARPGLADQRARAVGAPGGTAAPSPSAGPGGHPDGEAQARVPAEPRRRVRGGGERASAGVVHPQGGVEQARAGEGADEGGADQDARPTS
eukprot:6031544-Pyramimonas_sp.AAC.1